MFYYTANLFARTAAQDERGSPQMNANGMSSNEEGERRVRRARNNPGSVVFDSLQAVHA
jgi:hypothetical protein